MKKILLIGLAIQFGLMDLSGQEGHSYVPPMDIPLLLAGNFGELRRNHFHTGIDIKTQGRQGIPILAIADGYVSRIKVSSDGYGNAIYVDHPDGNTSVYAHLRVFDDSISKFMKSKQYDAKCWELDYYPKPQELEVQQGEVIALSGNSGSSSGPHLHFEIRETLSEHPLNPLNFGFNLKDERKPEIKGVRVYPLDSISHLGGSSEARSFVAVADQKGRYTIREQILVNGEIGLALHTYDRMSDVNNKFGVYGLEMKVNGRPHYGHKMDELDFDNFRQVNCHKDYDLFHMNKWRYHKCFPAENNTLDIYDILVNGGRISVNQGDTLDIEFQTFDIAGNRSTLAFQLIGAESLDKAWPEEPGVLIDASLDNVFTVDGLAVRIPKGRVYEDFYLRPGRRERPDGPSDLFHLNDRDIPLDDEISISILNRNPPSEWQYGLVEHTDHRGRKKYIKGHMNNGWYEISSKDLGAYRLVEDRISPSIEVRYSSKNKKLSISVSDNLSGIDSVSVEIDGQWLRMAHNTSRTRAWGDIRELEIQKGTHDVKVYAIDIAGNEVMEIRKMNF